VRVRCAGAAQGSGFTIRMSTKAPPGFVIDPRTIYDDDAIRLGLRVSQNTIDSARRSGQLRFSRHGARALYLGAWVLEWLERSSAAVPIARTGGAL
jgi:hypothetical protein